MTATKKPPRSRNAHGGSGRAVNEAPCGEDDSGRDKRSVGRPPAAGEARSLELRVRVTPRERAFLDSRAERAGLPLSEYVRRALGVE